MSECERECAGALEPPTATVSGQGVSGQIPAVTDSHGAEGAGRRDDPPQTQRQCTQRAATRVLTHTHRCAQACECTRIQGTCACPAPELWHQETWAASPLTFASRNVLAVSGVQGPGHCGQQAWGCCRAGEAQGQAGQLRLQDTASPTSSAWESKPRPLLPRLGTGLQAVPAPWPRLLPPQAASSLPHHVHSPQPCPIPGATFLGQVWERLGPSTGLLGGVPSGTLKARVRVREGQGLPLESWRDAHAGRDPSGGTEKDGSGLAPGLGCL